MGSFYRVLLIDDDPGYSELMREYFEENGFIVHLANSGREGLQKLDHLHPDLVCVDLMMPGMDGFSLCEEIRNRADSGSYPVMVLTGLDDEADKIRAYQEWVDDFVAKSTQPVDVVERAILQIESYQHAGI